MLGLLSMFAITQLLRRWWAQGHLQFFMKEHEEAMKTYEQGLTFEKDNWELKEGLMKCQQAINKVGPACHVA